MRALRTQSRRLPERATSLTAAFAALSIVVGCHPGPSPADRSAVDNWLTCGECIDGERDSVRAASDEVVPLLAAALDTLPERVRTNAERELSEAWALIPQPSLTEAEYVEFFLSNLQATVQRRAVLALADRGEIDLLMEARDRYQRGLIEYRDDVRAEFDRAISGVATSGAVPTTRAASVEIQPGSLMLTVRERAFALAVVRDASGNELTGASVTWTATPSSVTTAVSDAPRRARVTGVAVGSATLEATVTGTTITDDAQVTVEAPPARRIVKVSGEPQIGTVGALLPDSLVVRVEEIASPNAPVQGVTVTWSVVLGSAEFEGSGGTTSMEDTDGNGRSSVQVRIGADARPVQIRAAFDGGAVTFRISVTS